MSFSTHFTKQKHNHVNTLTCSLGLQYASASLLYNQEESNFKHLVASRIFPLAQAGNFNKPAHLHWQMKSKQTNTRNKKWYVFYAHSIFLCCLLFIQAIRGKWIQFSQQSTGPEILPYFQNETFSMYLYLFLFF